MGRQADGGVAVIATTDVPPVPAERAAPAVATGPCAKAGDAIADVWPDERDAVESRHRRLKQDSTQVIAVIGLAARRLLCLDRVRARATARIMAVAPAARAEKLREELARIVAVERAKKANAP